MKKTVSVELKNENALNLLYNLEKMDILHIVREPEIEGLNNVKKLDVVSVNEVSEKIKFSERFRGIITKEQGESLKAHVKSSREEWDNRI